VLPAPSFSTPALPHSQPLRARPPPQVRQLTSSQALKKACPAPFDEGLLWRSEGQEKLPELQSAFHHITRLLDCVGCEKCKMHGKLNVLGIAAAMKVGAAWGGARGRGHRLGVHGPHHDAPRGGRVQMAGGR